MISMHIYLINDMPASLSSPMPFSTATNECYHLATDKRAKKREAVCCASFSEFRTVLQLLILPFEVSNDHLTSKHYHHHTCQPFCSLRCSEWANRKHLLTFFLSSDQRRVWLKTSSADDTRCQMFPQHQTAPPYCILGQTSQTPSQVFPQRTLPLHS